MKILIADDEELARYSVRSVLEELFAQKPAFLELEETLEIVEVATGSLMEKVVSEFQPDLGFVDIRMPGLSGLDAMDRINQVRPGIKWIILSGFSDFEYARRSLTLGVLEYLVKPVDPVDVSRVLSKAVEDLRQEWLVCCRDFEYKAAGVINNLSSPEFDPFFQEDRLYSGLVLFIDGPDESSKAGCLWDFSRRIRDSWTSRSRSPLYCLVALEGGSPAILCTGPSPSRHLEKDISLIEQWNLDHQQTGCCLKYQATQDFPDFQEMEKELTRVVCSGSLEGRADFLSQDLQRESVPLLVRKAREYGESHCTESVGVAQAAAFLGVTPNYLSSCFNRSMGMTFTKYITDLRLARAKERLAEPGITVKETATSLGYQSSRHFARLFREYYGCSPTDYIQSL